MSLPVALMDDAPPYLDFKHDTVEDRNRTNKTGRYSVRDIEVVEITPRGDSKTQIVRECSEWFEHLKDRLRQKQISQHYYDYCARAYEAWKEKGVMPVDGTPILGWTLASPALQKQIIDAKIRSVEDLATATEDALQAIGPGARELKRKAEKWVEQAEGPGKTAAKMASLEQELDTLRSREMERNEEMEAMRKELEALKKKK